MEYLRTWCRDVRAQFGSRCGFTGLEFGQGQGQSHMLLILTNHFWCLRWTQGGFFVKVLKSVIFDEGCQLINNQLDEKIFTDYVFVLPGSQNLLEGLPLKGSSCQSSVQSQQGVNFSVPHRAPRTKCAWSEAVCGEGSVSFIFQGEMLISSGAVSLQQKTKLEHITHSPHTHTHSYAN